MADRVKVSDLDFVYISYKEPNKEENWADLLSKVPWAKRVDGVKGFDSAHKAAAEKAETEFFISVDGDNILDESFLLETLDWSKTNPKAVHRWRAKNSVNGLVYGNGGLVGWPRETCLQMKTHENANKSDKKAQIDFCWSVPHENLHNYYSTTVINATSQQAFIAGYREGVKMSLNQGERFNTINFIKSIHSSNLRNLVIWMSVGADIENGKYAMLGSRMGCYSAIINKEDVRGIRNIDRMLVLIPEAFDNIDEELNAYGQSLRQRIGLPVADFDADQSKFFKFCYSGYCNRGVQDREIK